MDQAFAPAQAPAAGRFGAAVAVAVCFAIAALEGYDIQSLGVAAPSMAPALHLAKSQVGFAGSAAMIGLVVGAALGGWLADRVGRKPVLVTATAWFGVFSVASAFAPDADALMLARLFTGLGFGGAMPNMIAIATEISPPGRRAATVTAMFVGMPVGGALSALITRLEAVAADWRLIFVIGGVAPILIVPFALALLPETKPAHERQAKARPFLTLFGGGRAAPTLLMWAAFALTLLVQYLMLNWLPTLVVAKGLDKAAGALAALAFNAGGVAGGLAIGRLADRFGFRWPLAAAFALLIGALAGLALATGAAPIAALAAIAGFLAMGALFSLYALAPHYYPLAGRGSGTGAAVAAGRLGSIAGPALGGLLLAGGASGTQVVQALVPVVAAAGLAAVVLTIVGRAHESDVRLASPTADR